MSRVLVTGATGFVGSALLRSLCLVSEHTPVALVRGKATAPTETEWLRTHDLQTLQCTELQGLDVIVHCAARVHVMQEVVDDPLREFREANVVATLHLAREASKAGVRRFIFLSSIKVNGEESSIGRPYTADDIPSPVDAYGISKLEAEIGLRALAEETGLEIVIVRPVLVYGPGVKANFRSMMGWLEHGVPLPLGRIRNRRSLVALDNLVDLILRCIEHPAALNETFLVSDGEDLSTPELLRHLGLALGKPVRLLPVPTYILQVGARLVGKGSVAQRLCGSLQVDIDRTRNLLGWAPPITVDEALRRTAQHFLQQKG
jgi:UDP-glucose 4-epimerase